MSHFIVSARKYRPQKFEDVVGQGHVTKTLKNALQNDSLAHAFLFCGPRGVGKTTCARILAMAVNCMNRSADFEPCGACESCKSFSQQASMSIIELDAASNNSVEHIRSLNEQVRIPPQSGRYKVFIIDEVHMLSQSAFNAFLKTLEEPPAYAIFILATTEKHKIIPTILSRCQIFDFKRIQTSEIVKHLESICRQEEIQYEKEALFVLANKADGALRDALSMFDKVVSFSNKNLSYQETIENLNILDFDYYFRLIDAFLLEDIAAALLLINDVLTKGFEGDIFISGLAEHLRQLLVCKQSALKHLLHASKELLSRYEEQSNKTSESFIISLMEAVNDADINYRMAKNKALHIEMALIKMCYLNRMFSQANEEIIKKKEQHSDITLKESSSDLTAGRTSQSEGSIDQTERSGTVISESVSLSKKENNPTIDIQVKGTDRLSTPSLKSLNHILKKVEHEKANETVNEAKLLHLEDVNNAWQGYAIDQDSQTVRTVLEKTELRVKNGCIIAKVGSNVSKAVILQETRLIEKLRETLRIPKLTMEILVDESKMEESRPKILSNKEKYEALVDKNPILSKLQKDLDLQLENI